ncbi:MAG TPA: hypothetical protein VGD56_22430 [Gemmatirosa sp.]
MASVPSFPPNRHVPFKKEGWAPAIATIIAAAAFWTMAWTVHHRTFREPTDVMMRQVGEDSLPTSANNAGPVPGAPEHGGTAPGGNGAATKGAR